MPKLTAQEVLERPELYGKAEAFEGSIASWIEIECRALERYIGKTFTTLDAAGQRDFNNTLIKLVYWNWCWPDNEDLRSELLETVSHLQDVEKYTYTTDW